MVDQPVMREEFDVLIAAAKALSDQMATSTTTTTTLIAKVDNRNNNNHNHNNKKNQIRGGEPIRVHDGNNRIIVDSSSSKVEKTDFYEIMLNH